MAPIPIDLRKLRHFLDREWTIERIAMDSLDSLGKVRTTVWLRGRKGHLVLESEDKDVFEVCSRFQPSTLVGRTRFGASWISTGTIRSWRSVRRTWRSSAKQRFGAAWR